MRCGCYQSIAVTTETWDVLLKIKYTELSPKMFLYFMDQLKLMNP